MIPEAARRFTSGCERQFGAKLITVLLEGSFARDEQRPGSDIDLFVLLETLERGVLENIGDIVARIDTPNEINPAIVSLAEIESDPLLFGYLRVKCDGIVLYGALPEIKLPKDAALLTAKRIAVEVLMSSRHYLAVSEPVEKFAHGKLFIWCLKPLGFALRFFHLAKTGHYIRPTLELATEYPVLALDPVEDWQCILQSSLVICEEILSSAESEYGPSAESPAH